MNIYDMARSIGVELPSHLKMGSIQRCGTTHKPRGKSGWYNYHDSDACTIGNWENGETVTWFSDRHNNWIPSNQRAHCEAIKARQRVLEEEDRQLRQAKITTQWRGLKPISRDAVGNEYFRKKQIDVMPDFKLGYDNSTCIPMYKDRIVTGIQRIYPDGTKIMASGSQPSGACYPLGDGLGNSEAYFLCEGYATAFASFKILNEILDGKSFSVLTCFSANNLLNIYNMIHQKYGIMCTYVADLDPAGLRFGDETNMISFGFTYGYDASDLLLEYGLERCVEIFEEKLKIMFEKRKK